MQGQHFGRLTVIRDVGRTKQGKRLFECVCACGNLHNVVAGDLKSGRTVSCGCLRNEIARARQAAKRKDITGQQFGLGCVISLSDKTRRKSNGTQLRLWKLMCVCGNEYHASGVSLSLGR